MRLSRTKHRMNIYQRNLNEHKCETKKRERKEIIPENTNCAHLSSLTRRILVVPPPFSYLSLPCLRKGKRNDSDTMGCGECSSKSFRSRNQQTGKVPELLDQGEARKTTGASCRLAELKAAQCILNANAASTACVHRAWHRAAVFVGISDAANTTDLDFFSIHNMLELI